LKYFRGELSTPHGFFTRQGGVSTGPYASLNCSLSGADDPANVRHNRALVAAQFNIAPDHLLGLRQVHGPAVVTVTAPWAVGEGPAADAMVTSVPGIALGIVTADCAPVLFADEALGIVGAAHAGWRGALAGVLEATAAEMRALGAQTIRAVVGPCIQQSSYEVSADLRDPVLARDPADARFFAPGRPERWQFDLPGYCAARLATDGVIPEILPMDTCAEEQNFFSHRRRTLRGEGAIGHQISIICI
jgi:YfiH family protein